jgi:hypothetical protein
MNLNCGGRHPYSKFQKSVVIKAEQDLPGTEGGRGDRVGERGRGKK